MRVVAFGPALTAVDAADGGVDANGFPMTSCFVEELPSEITLPVVIAVAALAGGEYAPVCHLMASSPSGEQIATMRFGWQWDDDPDLPVKYRAFVQYLPVRIETPGVYTLSLGDTAEADQAPYTYPLAVFEADNPFLAPRDTAV